MVPTISDYLITFTTVSNWSTILLIISGYSSCSIIYSTKCWGYNPIYDRGLPSEKYWHIEWHLEGMCWNMADLLRGTDWLIKHSSRLKWYSGRFWIYFRYPEPTYENMLPWSKISIILAWVTTSSSTDIAYWPFNFVSCMWSSINSTWLQKSSICTVGRKFVPSPYTCTWADTS